MKKILITGAYGFIGTNLALYLKEKYELWALDVAELQEGLYRRFYTWNQLDEIPFDDIDTIIHLAGKAHDTKNKAEIQSYFSVNTGLTQKIFDEFIVSDSKSFIFFSSVKAAADFVEGEKLTENVVPKPVGPYGESKIKAEEYIQSKEWGDKRVYIFRPCMIHGPGNKGNLNLLYNVINRGFPYPLGKFDNKRSFTSIGNLCYIIDKIIFMLPTVPSGIYNISDDNPISTNELILLICEALDKKAKIWNIPLGLIKFCVKVGDVLHLPLNSFRLNKLTETYIVDNSKLKESLDIKQLPISTSAGILKTIKSFNLHSN
ncbi:NAD-dependent epimerase/dehydratase family protein [Dysgonomonas sp. Shenzhen-Wh21]|uniref:NAD-dependent epimerase/dehydratase family protein n=1 Tax=Dysgonomonas TaxID=156973 RepID=UPI00208E361C|nr:NAD-dependent epimerase/dehydratase family protein [Dysgonomonas mossii]